MWKLSPLIQKPLIFTSQLSEVIFLSRCLFLILTPFLCRLFPFCFETMELIVHLMIDSKIAAGNYIILTKMVRFHDKVWCIRAVWFLRAPEICFNGI